MRAERSSSRLPVRLPVRIWFAAGLTAATLVIAIGAGVLSSRAAPGPLVFVEFVSAHVSGALLLGSEGALCVRRRRRNGGIGQPLRVCASARLPRSVPR